MRLIHSKWVFGGNDQHDSSFECTLSEIYGVADEDGGCEKIVLTKQALRDEVCEAIRLEAARRLNDELEKTRRREERKMRNSREIEV